MLVIRRPVYNLFASLERARGGRISTGLDYILDHLREPPIIACSLESWYPTWSGFNPHLIRHDVLLFNQAVRPKGGKSEIELRDSRSRIRGIGNSSLSINDLGDLCRVRQLGFNSINSHIQFPSFTLLAQVVGHLRYAQERLERPF